MNALFRKMKFTLIELLVVITIIAIWASMLLPALKTVRGKAKQIACASNLKQWNTIFCEYTNDFEGYLPSGVPLPSSSVSYGAYWNNYNRPLREIFFPNASIPQWGGGNMINGCPTKTNNPFIPWQSQGFTYRHWSYMMCENTYSPSPGYSLKLSQIKNPSRLVLIAENIDTRYDSLFTTSNFPSRGGFRHGNQMNLLWTDGHISGEQLSEIDMASFLNN